jgi:hypothetical protein
MFDYFSLKSDKFSMAFLLFRTYALTENVRYVYGIFNASSFDFSTNESLRIHRRGVLQYAPTSLKWPFSVSTHDV